MSKLFFPILILLAVLVTGCKSSKPVELPSSSIIEKTGMVSKALPAQTAQPTLTGTPTPLPTITSTVTITPTVDLLEQKNAFGQQCVQVLPTLQNETVPSGILVIDHAIDGLYLWNFSQHSQRKIPGLIMTEGTSPDGKWLVYGLFKPKPHLIIESPDGKQQSQLATKSDWMLPSAFHWLDNQRVWFPWTLPNTDWSVPTSVTVLNLFTGQENHVVSDYPNIERYMYGMSLGPGYHFGYSSVAVDPSLNLMIYPESNVYLTLWDRKSHKALARIRSGGEYDNLPVWQPDLNRFLVVGFPNDSAWENGQREWFGLSPDGTVQQLTHFGDFYKEYQIVNNASLSPDGNYLVFGLSVNENDKYQPAHLILLNLKTLAAIDTCLNMGSPEWSPDSRFLALSGQEQKDGQTPYNPLFLLDLVQRRAFQIDKGLNYYPVGWLVQP